MLFRSMLVYSEYYFLKKQFFSIYEGVKALTMPLLFWNDLINAENSNSSVLLKKSIDGIKSMQNNILKKLNSTSISKKSFEFKISDIIGKATETLIEQISSKVISNPY